MNPSAIIHSITAVDRQYQRSVSDVVARREERGEEREEGW